MVRRGAHRGRRRLRLVCFPHAGGGALSYRGWGGLLGHDLEVCALEPPGRGRRISEPAYTHLSDYVAGVLPILQELAGAPLAFFGHSLGAMAAFETARALQARGLEPPIALVLSGHGPGDPPPTPGAMETAELLRYLERLNGTPPEVLENEELMELRLPTFRADLMLGAGHRYEAEPRSSSPILALGGSSDRVTSEASLRAWQRFTTKPFALQMYSGDHFFLRSSEADVLARVSSFVAEALQAIQG